MAPMREDLGSKIQALNLFLVAARTTTVNGTGVDRRNHGGRAIARLNCAAGSGTSPTLDVTLQDSDDDVTYAAISGAAFTQVVGVASRQSINVDLDNAGPYVRAVATIGGTNPSFTFSVDLFAPGQPAQPPDA